MQNKSPTTITVLVVLAAVLTFSGTARADVIFTLGNNPQPNEENILFQTPETGLTINGFTSKTNVDIFFTTLTGQDLLQQAQGQADILQNVANPAQNSALTSMNISAPGFGFGD